MVVPIPKLMQGLPRDRRGYPIPAGVWRDEQGTPHFTINDESRRYLNVHENVCPICGTNLKGIRWFVGGPLSAFHPQGSYMDPPMHRQCVHYALKVCPYLAAPNYSKRIDAKTLTQPLPKNRIFIDPTQIPIRPPVFVAVSTASQTIRWPYVKPNMPYISVEYWKEGEQLDKDEGEKLVGVAINEYLKEK